MSETYKHEGSIPPKEALETIQMLCCYREEDASVNVDELLTSIRCIATKGLDEEWKG